MAKGSCTLTTVVSWIVNGSSTCQQGGNFLFLMVHGSVGNSRMENSMDKENFNPLKISLIKEILRTVNFLGKE